MRSEITISEADLLGLLADAWDAAVASMRYEDGTPVEIVGVVNPYRTQPL